MTHACDVLNFLLYGFPNIYNYMLAGLQPLTNVLITFIPADVTNQHLY